jgi:hypothetical protein
MRRRLVLLAALSAVATGFATASASASGDSPLIVCPLHPSGRAVGCCPLPTVQPIPCCGASSIPCVAGLTIASSQNPSQAGHSVTLSGRLATGAAGATIGLWQQLPEGGFKQIAQTTTGSSGAYRFIRTDVSTNRQWYVTAAGATSPVLSQRVRAVVTLSRSFVVRVAPNHGGGRVLIEQWSKEGWRVMLRARLGPGSRAQLQVVARHGQTLRLRAVLPADRRNVRSFSKAIRTTF